MKNKRGFGGFAALAAAMLMAVLLFAGSFTMQAEAETTGKVTATSANVRKEADKNSDAVGGLLKNDTFVVKGKVTGADGKIWYLIVFGNDSEGYVRSDLVSVDGEVDVIENPTTTTPSVQTSGVTKLNPVSGTVTGKTVNIRAGAGADTDKVSSVNKGDVLTIIGQATGSDDKVWYQVTFISNNQEVTGFIRSDYVDPAGNLTPYQEPVTQPDPTEPSTESTEPDVQEPEEQEPTVEVTKDWDTVKVDEKWMLVENASGKYYSVNDLIQISKENATKLEAANGTIGGQKAAIVILVIILIVLILAVAFVVFRFKDLIMEEILGMKDEPAPVRRPATQGQRPAGGQGQRPAGQGQRPTGAPGQRPGGTQGQRPAGAPGQRPAGAPAQRPAGTPGQRPAGAPAQRPAGTPGQRPAGAPAQRPNGTPGQRPAVGGPGQRPAGAPAQRPVGGSAQRPVSDAPAQKSVGVSVEGLSPAFDMTETKEEQIRKETNKSIENQQMESKVALNDNVKKPKNFMADEDEFEFEFLNWDGDDEE